MRKFLSFFILAALLSPLVLATAKSARGDDYRSFPAQTKKPKPDPKPDPKPGPREGGADD